MTEVCTDIALGVTTQILWLVILIESLVTESLMGSWLKPHGVFFLFGFCSLVAFVFEFFMVAETQGYSERERKELYMPGAKYGRQLKPYERVKPPSSPTLSLFSDLSGSVHFSNQSRQ